MSKKGRRPPDDEDDKPIFDFSKHGGTDEPGDLTFGSPRRPSGRGLRHARDEHRVDRRRARVVRRPDDEISFDAPEVERPLPQPLGSEATMEKFLNAPFPGEGADDLSWPDEPIPPKDEVSRDPVVPAEVPVGQPVEDPEVATQRAIRRRQREFAEMMRSTAALRKPVIRRVRGSAPGVEACCLQVFRAALLVPKGDEAHKDALLTSLGLLREAVDPLMTITKKDFAHVVSVINLLVQLDLKGVTEATMGKQKMSFPTKMAGFVLPIRAVEQAFGILRKVLEAAVKAEEVVDKDGYERLARMFRMSFLMYCPIQDSGVDAGGGGGLAKVPTRPLQSIEELYVSLLRALRTYYRMSLPVSLLDASQVGTFIVSACGIALPEDNEASSRVSREMKLEALLLSQQIVEVVEVSTAQAIFPGVFRYVVGAFFRETACGVLAAAFRVLGVLLVRVLPPRPAALVGEVAIRYLKKTASSSKSTQVGKFLSHFQSKAASGVIRVLTSTKFLQDPRLLPAVVACCTRICRLADVETAFGNDAAAFLEPLFFLPSRPSPSEEKDADKKEEEGEVVSLTSDDDGWEEFFAPFRGTSSVDLRFASHLNFRRTGDEGFIRRTMTILAGYVRYKLISPAALSFQLTKICSTLFRVLEVADDNVIDELHTSGRRTGSKNAVRFRWFHQDDTLQQIVAFALELDQAEGHFLIHLLEMLGHPSSSAIHFQCLVLLPELICQGTVAATLVTETLFQDHLWRRCSGPIDRQVDLSVKERFQYVLSSSLCLDVLRCLATRVSRLQNPQQRRRQQILFLRDVLFRLFEKVGDDNDRLSEHALFVLKEIAETDFKYESLAHLVALNSDFFIDDLLYDLQYPDLFPNSVLVVRNVLRYIERSGDEVTANGDVFDRLLDIINDLIDHVSILLSSDVHDYRSVGTVLQIFESVVAILLMKRPLPDKNREILHRVLDQMQHFLGSADRFVRSKILDIFVKFAEGVSQHKKGDKEFKVINTIWPPLMRLAKKETNPDVRKRAIRTISILLESGFDQFLHARFCKDLLPTFLDRSVLQAYARDVELAGAVLELFRVICVSSKVFRDSLTTGVRALEEGQCVSSVVEVLFDVFARKDGISAKAGSVLDEIGQLFPEVMWSFAFRRIGGCFEKRGLPRIRGLAGPSLPVPGSKSPLDVKKYLC